MFIPRAARLGSRIKKSGGTRAKAKVGAKAEAIGKAEPPLEVSNNSLTSTSTSTAASESASTSSSAPASDSGEPAYPPTPVIAIPSLNSSTIGTVHGYKRLAKLGEGRFGIVWKAVHVKTQATVAIKSLKLNCRTDRGFPLEVIREMGILTALQRTGRNGSRHPNILQLVEVVMDDSGVTPGGGNLDMSSWFLVTEYAEFTLARVLEMRRIDRPFTEAHVKTMAHDLFSALEHLHERWFIHRDVKVDNVLVSSDGVLKLADFGSARRFGKPLEPMTPGMVSGHYRSPELLLGTDGAYGPAVDVWAVACVICELLSGTVLFPGQSELDQLSLVFSMLGVPTAEEWPSFGELVSRKGLTWKVDAWRRSADRGCGISNASGRRRVGMGLGFPKLRAHFPAEGYDPLHVHAASFTRTALSSNGFDLLKSALQCNPEKRISAAAALAHPWFLQRQTSVGQALPSLEAGRLSRSELEAMREAWRSQGTAVAHK